MSDKAKDACAVVLRRMPGQKMNRYNTLQDTEGRGVGKGWGPSSAADKHLTTGCSARAGRDSHRFKLLKPEMCSRQARPYVVCRYMVVWLIPSTSFSDKKQSDVL